jgi:catechol 2,3-dioxygenase-like lactoylglutathione lyase family enzyme
MRITVTSILVDNQAKAFDFYTTVLGFVKKTEIPMGDVSWLTVVSPEQPDGVEISLEPDWNPAVDAKGWKKSLFDANIPATSFAVDDVQAEYERLTAAGVRFTQPPSQEGPVTTAVFDDTCGNLIMIASA